MKIIIFCIIFKIAPGGAVMVSSLLRFSLPLHGSFLNIFIPSAPFAPLKKRNCSFELIVQGNKRRKIKPKTINLHPKVILRPKNSKKKFFWKFSKKISSTTKKFWKYFLRKIENEIHREIKENRYWRWNWDGLFYL